MECEKLRKIISRSGPLRVKQFCTMINSYIYHCCTVQSLNSVRSNAPEAEKSIHGSVSPLLNRSSTSVCGEAQCLKPGNRGYALSEVRDYKLHPSASPIFPLNSDNRELLISYSFHAIHIQSDKRKLKGSES